jgi:hypothetical protein
LYCMNCKQKRSAVFFWFHEVGEFEPYAKSISEFIYKVFQFHAECVVDELSRVAF